MFPILISVSVAPGSYLFCAWTGLIAPPRATMTRDRTNANLIDMLVSFVAGGIIQIAFLDIIALPRPKVMRTNPLTAAWNKLNQAG